jgi:hypothetical protein
MSYFCRGFAVILALTSLAGRLSVAHADEAAVAGRALLDRHKNSVVTVRLVIKLKSSFMGADSHENEHKGEVTGTVIDPNGLTVVSLAATDPASIFSMMMESEGASDEFKMESEVADVKIILADNTELPAKVVLRDKDWDLAFVRPTKKLDAPLQALNLSKSAKPEVLDEVVALNRLGKVAGRAYAASLMRIEAVVSRPRIFYVPGQGASAALMGAPVFSFDGNIVGIMLLRTVPGEQGGMSFGACNIQEGTMPIVVPAADILEAAQQAPSAEVVPATPPAGEATPQG